MKVLITGARAPVAIDLARAFYADGHHVELADYIRSFAASALPFSPVLHRLPAPSSHFDAFACRMAELITHGRFDLVVPTCEEVFWLAAAAERGQWSDRLLAPELPLLRRLHSKAEFPTLLAECGLQAPRTMWLDTPPDPTQFPDLSSLVFKPEFSRFATHTLIGPSASALARINASPDHPWVAQQRIHGEEICSWTVMHAGRMTAHIAYRPRWRHGHAAAYGMEAVDCPAAVATARRIGEVTGMTGQIAFDMILDAAGEVWPIECNPRAVSGLHFFDAKHELAQAMAFGRRLDPPASGTLRHMAPAMALFGFPAAITGRKLTALWDDWCKGFDVIARGQTAVALGSLADAAQFAALALRKRVSPAGATTDGIEWDGRPIV